MQAKRRGGWVYLIIYNIRRLTSVKVLIMMSLFPTEYNLVYRNPLEQIKQNSKVRTHIHQFSD